MSNQDDNNLTVEKLLEDKRILEDNLNYNYKTFQDFRKANQEFMKKENEKAIAKQMRMRFLVKK